MYYILSIAAVCCSKPEDLSLHADWKEGFETRSSGSGVRAITLELKMWNMMQSPMMAMEPHLSTTLGRRPWLRSIWLCLYPREPRAETVKSRLISLLSRLASLSLPDPLILHLMHLKLVRSKLQPKSCLQWSTSPDFFICLDT